MCIRDRLHAGLSGKCGRHDVGGIMVAIPCKIGDRHLRIGQRFADHGLNLAGVHRHVGSPSSIAAHIPPPDIRAGSGTCHMFGQGPFMPVLQHPVLCVDTVSYTHLRAHETVLDLVCRLLLEKKNNKKRSHENNHKNKIKNT
eukprot:TRINITY_DN439_c0_g1_i1.p1 TRINITY_DN439_c0_g1~~TRINITY_DN439_c0_g1_i1.p1  ORF type:complete len:142 (+),score=36.31 TRINITY_DN439_c0_g1_i1:153-578(+)